MGLDYVRCFFTWWWYLTASPASIVVAPIVTILSHFKLLVRTCATSGFDCLPLKQGLVRSGMRGWIASSCALGGPRPLVLTDLRVVHAKFTTGPQSRPPVNAETEIETRKPTI